MNEIKGFTPVSDFLCQEYDTYTALVYGKVWRYWDYGGKCSAAVKRIADELGISEKTVTRKLQILEKNGYIEKLREGKNAGLTNVWIPTHKIAYRTTVVEVREGRSESPTPRSESPTPSVRESYKDTNKKDKKDKKDSPAPTVQGAPNDEPFAGLPDTPLPEKQKTEYAASMEILEYAFAAARGCKPPDWERDAKAANKRWRTPLAKKWREYNRDTQLLVRGIEAVTKQMMASELTFDAPDQIIKTLSSWLIDVKNHRSNGGAKVLPVVIAPEVDTRKTIAELRAESAKEL